MQKFTAAQFLVDERPVGNETSDGLCSFRLSFHVVAAQEDLTGAGFENAHHHAYGRGFASPVGAEKAEDLSALNLEIQRIYRREMTIPLGDVDQFDHFKKPQSPEFSD